MPVYRSDRATFWATDPFDELAKAGHARLIHVRRRVQAHCCATYLGLVDGVKYEDLGASPRMAKRLEHILRSKE
jgi:hypothetical protein